MFDKIYALSFILHKVYEITTQIMHLCIIILLSYRIILYIL